MKDYRKENVTIYLCSVVILSYRFMNVQYFYMYVCFDIYLLLLNKNQMFLLL